MSTFVAAHKELDVWKRALRLAEITYRLTGSFPTEERFGLSAQMRRAAVSVLSNISEGAARHSPAEYIRFLHIARGSLAELDAQFILAERLRFVSEDSAFTDAIQHVGRLLNAQLASLRR